MKRILPTLIIGLAVVAAALILGGQYNYKFRQQKTISVTGGAKVSFVSDLIVWKGSYSRRAATLEQAFSALKSDEKKVRAFLSAQGLDPSQVIFSAVDISKDYQTTYDSNGRMAGRKFTGYTLMQNIKVQSKEIAKVEKISREITSLIQSGVEFNSQAPAYYYTKLSGLKIDLLSKASADGRLRAETIAEKSNNDLGGLKKADMGVFQIIGEYSGENYTWGGAFNTSSKKKTASITVQMEFELE